MADYNVNMKQWNGTSFDNVLPLAYNAKQLEGQSLAEIKRWVHDNELLLYTGQYIGTGTYGISNKITLTFPFEPIIWFPPFYSPDNPPLPQLCAVFSSGAIGFRPTLESNSSCYVSMSDDRKSISFYSNYDVSSQLNINGYIYYFAAIGGPYMSD